MFIDTNISNLYLGSLEMKKVSAAIVRADANAWQREQEHRLTVTTLRSEIFQNALQAMIAIARQPFIHLTGMRNITIRVRLKA